MAQRPYVLPTVNTLSVALLCGRGGRLPTLPGCFRRGQGHKPMQFLDMLQNMDKPELETFVASAKAVEQVPDRPPHLN